MRIWTAEARQRQSEVARRDRPWQKSTGPRTAEGKNRSRLNAVRTGFHSAENRALLRQLTDALRLQRH